jgi:hypothetical protein
MACKVTLFNFVSVEFHQRKQQNGLLWRLAANATFIYYNAAVQWKILKTYCKISITSSDIIWSKILSRHNFVRTQALGARKERFIYFRLGQKIADLKDFYYGQPFFLRCIRESPINNGTRPLSLLSFNFGYFSLREKNRSMMDWYGSYNLMIIISKILTLLWSKNTNTQRCRTQTKRNPRY